MAIVFTPETSRTRIRPRSCTRQPLLYTHAQLVQLLNDDLCRERKVIHAYAVFRMKSARSRDRTLAAEIEKSVLQIEDQAIRLEQIIRDLNGRVEADVDELNAILGADRFIQPAWCGETIQRLHDRARQLRTAGFPGLAKRMTRIVAEKQRGRDLSERLLAIH